MANRLFKTPLRALNASGDPVPGAKVYLYETGTTTPVSAYTDSGGGTPHATPLVADGGGTFAELYVNGSAGVKVKVTDSAGTTLDGYPVDPVLPESSSTSGASGIGFTPTAVIPSTDVQAAIERVGDIVNGEKGVDVSSGSILTLGTDGDYFDITGATTVNGIATIGVGKEVTLHFDGALQLTHNATSFFLPGAANITTAAGDEVKFREYSTGNFRCTGYLSATGETVGINASGATEPGQAFVADGVGGGVWRHVNDHGGFRYTDHTTGLTITTPVAYTLVNPAGSATHLEGFTYNSLGRLTYDGVNSAHAHMVNDITFKHSSGGGADVYFAIYKNGVATGAEIVQAATSSGFQHIAIHEDVGVVTNDYYELFLKTASGSVVVHSQYMFAMTMPEGS